MESGIKTSLNEKASRFFQLLKLFGSRSFDGQRQYSKLCLEVGILGHQSYRPENALSLLVARSRNHKEGSSVMRTEVLDFGLNHGCWSTAVHQGKTCPHYSPSDMLGALKSGSNSGAMNLYEIKQHLITLGFHDSGIKTSLLNLLSPANHMPPFGISPAPSNTAVHFKDVTSFALLCRVLQETYGFMHYTLGIKDEHYVIGTFTSHGPTVEEVLLRKGVIRRVPPDLEAASHVESMDQEDSASKAEVIDLTGED